ncbi:MAG TPA: PAS domain-containing protein [Treponemataceae bacterium]|jgi:hypothetical protein|nr:PAS domain-containing protein [Treponemataceae bacterium]
MEPLQNLDKDTQLLAQYFQSLAEGERSAENLEKYKNVLQKADAFMVNDAVDYVLENAADISLYKIPVSRLIRSCAEALDAQNLPVYTPGSSIHSYAAINEKISLYLADIQQLSKGISDGTRSLSDLITELEKFELIQNHYIDLQNGLFSMFEQASPRHRCVSLMWAIQDDVITLYKKLYDETRQCLASKETTPLFWKYLGEFYITAGSLVYRERMVLYPAAYRYLSHIKAAPVSSPSSMSFAKGDDSVSFKTGALSLDNLERILNLLPLDFSFVGPDDRVQFYSDPAHRIFPRSPSVVGRLVENCHPPKSVNKVKDIISSFKDGSRDRAEFYLTIKDKFIHIEYFAVRDDKGAYCGTLEVSQDATHVRSLAGEKRLL